MSVLFLFFGGIGLGFILIFLIAVTSPKPEPVDLKKESSSPLVELDSEELGKLVSAHLDKMGLEIERITGASGEIIEIRAVNPTPVTGGTLLVQCIVPAETGRLDGPAVGQFIRAVRTAYVSKGLLFTNGKFTPDGRLAAEDAPVELFDRDQIQKLVDQLYHDDGESLPQLVAKLPSMGGVNE